MREMGDPGAYDPHEHDGVAMTARRMHRKSDKEGKSGFGAQTARVLRLWGSHNGRQVKPQETPGPGAYSMQLDEKGKEYEMSCKSDGESMKSASSRRRSRSAAPLSCRRRPTRGLGRTTRRTTRRSSTCPAPTRRRTRSRR